MAAIMDNSMATGGSSEDFVAVYNQRDLILYAISVGFGGSKNKDQQDEELKYVYERHPGFTAVPTFCLALSFWAKERSNGAGSSYEIPPFPPATMSSTGTIPSHNLSTRDEDASQYPLIHMNQSIEWHCPLPIPDNNNTQIRTRLRKRILSIVPKSIGTFVTSETEIWEDTANVHLATLQGTFLVMGIPPEHVIAMQTKNSFTTKKPPKIPRGTTPDFQWTLHTSPNQALLYRLASGDSNKIHVVGDDTMANVLGDTTPILHGLCTFGMATRAILHHVGRSQNGVDVFFEKLEGRFTKPVFLNDSLGVKLWTVSGSGTQSSSSRSIAFEVVNETRGEAVLEGLVRLRTQSSKL